MKMTKAEFLKEVTMLILETYPVTSAIVEREFEKLIKGEKPTNIIGMLVEGNLRKIEITDMDKEEKTNDRRK